MWINLTSLNINKRCVRFFFTMLNMKLGNPKFDMHFFFIYFSNEANN